MRKLFRKIRLVLYWGLPPLILYIIFSRIDFDRLIGLVVIANTRLIFIGTAFIFLKIFMGALRWYFLIKSYDCACLTLRASIVEYWLSLTLGVVIPGSLGSDAYRIALGGKQTAKYLTGAFVIGIEKIAALFSCAVLIASLYPFLLLESLPNSVSYTLDAAYLFLVLSLAILVLAIVTHHNQWFKKIIDSFAWKISDLAIKVEGKVRRQPFQGKLPSRPPLELFMSAFKLGVALPTFLLSFAIHIVGAVQSQLFFQALGYDLPFLVNLFVAPLILLAFTLPISFGGLGIREGVFIVFYGAFGVPPETALLVSFCGLSSVLIGHAFGVLLFFTRGRQAKNLAKPLNNPAQEE